MTPKSDALSILWHGLQGTWQLKRSLHSLNAAEPSGNCTGVAAFTSRQPAVFVNADGKLQMASQEMLYSEQGEFDMASTVGTPMPKFSFSRKYVWRLQDENAQQPEISVWFVKPGTEEIDYLFHKFLVQSFTEDSMNDSHISNIECSGGHLCVEDYYSSTYAFQFSSETQSCGGEDVLASWTMLHEVRGPKKDQVIETTFTKA